MEEFGSLEELRQFLQGLTKSGKYGAYAEKLWRISADSVSTLVNGDPGYWIDKLGIPAGHAFDIKARAASAAGPGPGSQAGVAGPGPGSQAGSSAVHDTSEQVFKQLGGGPHAEPIPIAELSELISRPAALPCKLPIDPIVLQQVYSNLSLSDQFLATPEGAKRPARLTAYITCVLARSGLTSRGEAGLHLVLDSFILDLWRHVATYSGTVMTFSRDKVDKSSASLALRRPDLTGYIGTALVLKGEEKDDPSDLAVAANELISKASKRWSPLHFGQAPYIVCYAAAGSLLQWYALTPRLSLEQLHPGPFDLGTDIGRLRALVASLHCCRAALSLATTLPKLCGLQLYTTRVRNHGTTLFPLEDRLVKHIHNFVDHYVQVLHLTRLEYVKTAYEIAASSAGLVVPVKQPTVKGDVYKVEVELGYCAVPGTVAELFEAVHCVLQGLAALHQDKLVHRDVRWENVVRFTDSRSPWALIDLEAVWAADEVPLCGRLTAWSDSTLINGKYNTASDLRLVAGLLRSSTVPGGPKKMKFEEAMASARAGMTAADAQRLDDFLAWEQEAMLPE